MSADKAPIFLRFDGLLSEAMDFVWRRGWETTRISNRPISGRGDFAVDLRDKDGSVIVSARPRVDFKAACFGPSSALRQARVTENLPYHPDAVAVVFHRGGSVIFESQVAPQPPRVNLLKLSVDANTLHLKWEASHCVDLPLTFNVFCFQREVGISVLERDLNAYAADVALNGLPGGDTQFAVLATDGLRSAFALSDVMHIDDKPPQVRILSPFANAIIPAGEPLSLVGNASDSTGKQLSAEGLQWRIDGVSVASGMEVYASVGCGPGEHHIELALLDPEGRDTALAGRTIVVADYTAGQRRHRQVMGFDAPAREEPVE